MPTPQVISALVDRFEEHVDTYKSGSYNETQLRRDFLDPFFKALGWDVDNEQGWAEAYRDVLHEDHVRVGGALKAPDYGFRIGGERKFFLEAKKPSVRIRDDVSPAYQLRRYAWSAKLSLSILSDFEEFAVYDCRIKPAQTDPASKARIFFCTYREYEKHWDFLSSTFSREAVLKGSFDKYAETNKSKKGTAQVDTDFLATIETWRAELARNLALRNPALSQRELNFAVQTILDRIIFLRICEDRGIEDYKRLYHATGRAEIYRRLMDLFRQADARYNSGLFHFKPEPGRHEPPDALTLKLKIDDDLLKDIVQGLYYPDSPYEFSVLGADILGQVYEQFLGKVIRLTNEHRAIIEDKPEVKKAGGVYYTPIYIVDYITRKTIGPLLQEKSPKQIASLRILDPACGSGSFLIGAYQFLLNWYHRWYSENDARKWAKGKNPVLVSAHGGGWSLTTAERKRILLAHIYGVDIDSQAVEVTKLSLLLKVLEGETAQTIQRELIHERVLPDLGNNIKCGNSLIESNFYAQPELPALDDETIFRVNAFDWQGRDGFPTIMASGGFDAVIGNPPYIRIQRIAQLEANYLFQAFSTPTSKMDLSLLFIEKSLQLAKRSGRIGLICTSQWMSADYGQKLRETLAGGYLHHIVNFGSLPVFTNASTYPAILILSPSQSSTITLKRIKENEELCAQGIENAKSQEFSIALLSSRPWNFGDCDIASIILERKIRVVPLRLHGKAYIGTKCGLNEAFVMTRQEAVSSSIEPKILLPYAYRGSEVDRYRAVIPDSVIIYPYQAGPTGEPVLMTEHYLKQNYPNAYDHLLSFKPALRERQDSRKFYAKGPDWYRHLRAGSYNYIRPSKLAVKGIALRSSIGLLPKNTAFDGARCPCIILEQGSRLNEAYLLGLMNSKLAACYLKGVCPPKLNGYIEFSARGLTDFPVRVIDPKNQRDVAAHDRIVTLVGQMLALHQKHMAALTPHELTALDRQIAGCDAQIDREVYDLYGLKPAEIQLVEDAL